MRFSKNIKLYHSATQCNHSIELSQVMITRFVLPLNSFNQLFNQKTSIFAILYVSNCGFSKMKQQLTKSDELYLDIRVYSYYLGMYNTLSATTKPTVTTKFVAGKKGMMSRRTPKTNGMCFCN